SILSFTLRPPSWTSTLPLHDALPIWHPDVTEHPCRARVVTAPRDDREGARVRLHDHVSLVDTGEPGDRAAVEADALGERLLELGDRKSTRLNSSHVKISYAVFCLKKK